jgi:secreted trypsin-like serine protease
MRRSTWGFFAGLICVVSVAVGCGGDSDSDGGGSASFAGGAACSSIGYTKALKVADGEQCVADSGSDTSSVVKLSIVTRSGDVATCTGTVISPTAVLTAAHCFAFEDIAGTVVTAVAGGTKVDISGSGVAIHPGFSVSSERVFFNDVAVVRTSARLPVPPIPLLLSRAPGVEEESLVAGYGQTENDGPAVDDVIAGRAVIRLVTDNHIRIDFRGGESHPCRGDSGGALFVEQDGGLAIVGVVSQSDPSISSDQVCKKGDKTLYANTQQNGIVDFILSQARDAAVK